jgi:hypothetical protein
MERDLIERPLFPLFGLGKPKNLTLGIQQRALSADKFLAANFDELVHELHSAVKPIYTITLAESGRKCFNLMYGNNSIFVPVSHRSAASFA